MFIGDWIGRSAQRYGERIAVVDLDKGAAGRFTYRALDERAMRLASFLRARGVARGDRVALLAFNGVEYLDALFACGKLGAVFVPFNHRLHPRELRGLVDKTAPKQLLFGPDCQALVAALAADLPDLPLIHLGQQPIGHSVPYETILASPALPITCEDLGPEDLACLLCTGGTTGLPKAAMLSHRMLAWNILTTVLHELDRSDVTVTHTPMFHTGGLFVYTLGLLALGGKVVLMRRWEPARLLDLLPEERVTVFFAVPTQYLQLSQCPGFATADFSTVRFLTSGGAPLPLSILEAFSRHHRVPFKQGFGMTEFGPGMFSMEPEFAVAKMGSIGRPNYFVDARLVHDDGTDVPVGHVGELWVRGPALCSGYFADPVATAESIDAAGWLHTGDLCRCDPDGFYYVVDRKKDMFISGGENVYPIEIEQALCAHPDVSQCAVIGVSDEKWGHVGHAFIVPKPAATLDAQALTTFLQSRLARYKVPKHVTFLAELPLSPAGKILKRALRAP